MGHFAHFDSLCMEYYSFDRLLITVSWLYYLANNLYQKYVGCSVHMGKNTKKRNQDGLGQTFKYFSDAPPHPGTNRNLKK